MPPSSSSGCAVKSIRLARVCNAHSQRAMPAAPRLGATGIASIDGDGCGAWLSPLKNGIKNKIPQTSWRIVEFLFQERAVLVGIETKAFHLARKIRTQGLRRTAHPGGDDRFHADAVLALIFGHG